MQIEPELPTLIAQIVPVFFVIAVFNPVRFRADVPAPHKWAWATSLVQRVALPVMLVLLLWSVFLVAMTGPLTGPLAYVYAGLVCVGGGLVYLAVIARLDEVKDAVAALQQQAAEEKAAQSRRLEMGRRVGRGLRSAMGRRGPQRPPG